MRRRWGSGNNDRKGGKKYPRGNDRADPEKDELVRGLAKGLLAAALVVSASQQAVAFKGYRLLRLDGHYVKWGGRVLGSGATVTYALVNRTTRFPDARNCAGMMPVDWMLSRLKISKKQFQGEVEAAFGLWSRAANLVFEPASDPASADILIGVQAEPRGRAYTNVDYEDAGGKGPRTIRQSLICLNPVQPWKIGFNGNLDVYDLRYSLAHEIGHAIGLDHPSGSGELMDFRYQEQFRGPQAGDISGVVALYGAPLYAGSVQPTQSDSADAQAVEADNEQPSSLSLGQPDWPKRPTGAPAPAAAP